MTTTTTTTKANAAEVTDAIENARRLIAELPETIRAGALSHFEGHLLHWEALHGKPLEEEDDVEGALVGVIWPDLDELCDGGTWTTMEAVSIGLRVLAFELRALKAVSAPHIGQTV